MAERFQLALVAPRLDGETVAARFWRRLLPLLREEIDVEVFAAVGEAGDGRTSIDELHPRRYQQILYVVEDTPQCGFMARAIRAIGGTVDLFSWELPRLALSAWPELEVGGRRGFLRSVKEGGLGEALAWRKSRNANEASFNRSIIRHGDAFIVRDEALGDRVRSERNENTAIGSIHDPGRERAASRERADVRSQLELPADWNRATVVASFSPLHPGQRELLMRAMERVHAAHPEVRVLCVDRSGRSRRGALPAGSVRVLDPSNTWRVLEAADVAVHLPHEPGASSGEVHEALAHGRCVVTTQSIDFDTPRAVRACEKNPQSLADTILSLISDSSEQALLEQGALTFMNEERRWQHAARLYSQFLQSFPEPRAARRSLIAARLRETERRAAARAENSSGS